MTRPAVRIAGTGSSPPERVLTNADLARTVDTSEEWIVQRTGILERRIAAPEDCPSDLGVRAARRALEEARVSPGEVDLILCANTLADQIFPGTSCFIQRTLGCANAGALDVNAACTGFLYALHCAWGMIESGRHRNILCVGTETLSRMTNWKDRTTCVLFGDGAGAMLLQASDKPGSAFLAGSLGADGSQAELVQSPGGGARIPPGRADVDPATYSIQMDGRAVYKFAVNKFVELCERTAAHAGVGLGDVALLVPHQMNLRIIEAAAERLRFPKERILVNIQKYGNTSAASVPTAFDEAVREGRLRRGDLALLVAFGGGLTWGSLLLRF